MIYFLRMIDANQEMGLCTPGFLKNSLYIHDSLEIIRVLNMVGFLGFLPPYTVTYIDY